MQKKNEYAKKLFFCIVPVTDETWNCGINADVMEFQRNSCRTDIDAQVQ